MVDHWEDYSEPLLVDCDGRSFGESLTVDYREELMVVPLEDYSEQLIVD